MSEKIDWITVHPGGNKGAKGQPIPVKEGQSKAEAIKEHFDSMEDDDGLDYVDVFESNNDEHYNLEISGYDDWSLTSKEKNAIEEYTSYSFPYNKYLRRNGSDDKEIDNVINNLDNAIQKFDLQDNILVYRMADLEWLDILNHKVGDIVGDKGYSSTTLDKNRFDKIKSKGGAHGDILFTIKVPKGKGHGAYTPYYSHFGGDEEEFLLPRNQKFKITKINGKNIELEAIY